MTEVLGTKQENYSGDFVLQTQETAEKSGFSHVSKVWFDKCMTFDKALDVLAEQQKVIEDIKAPLSAWEAIVDNDKFALKYKATGKCYTPTEHCITELCTASRMGSWQIDALTKPIRHPNKTGPDGEKQIIFNREKCDAECIVSLFNAHVFHSKRMDQNKTRLFRTWSDGTMRAFLSDKYAIINNHWVLEQFSKLIPGGMLSHWRGDADEICGNILIPDTIRAESDSDYGGMLSVGNSEIGTKRISSLPSVFRSVCMNGCIHNHEFGEAIDKVHLGKVDYNAIFLLMKENLEKQIPLLSSGIDKMMKSKELGFGDTPSINMLAQLAVENSDITKKDIVGLASAFLTEAKVLGSTTDTRTAFGLTSAITRYGQTLSNDRWVAYDKLGGTYINMNRDTWDSFRTRAKNIRKKDFEKYVGPLAMAQAL